MAGLFGEPAAQAFQRPDVAEAGLRLDDVVGGGDDVEGFLVVETGAGRELDEHVDGIGAGELLVERLAGGDRLLLVGDLIGEAIARVEPGIDEGQADDDDQADQAVDQRVVRHAVGDPVAEAPEGIDAGVVAGDLRGEDGFLADQQHAEQRPEQDHRHQRDGGGDGAGKAEGADEVGIGNQQGDERAARRRARSAPAPDRRP